MSNPCADVKFYRAWPTNRFIVDEEDLAQIRYYAGQLLIADPLGPIGELASEIAFIADNILDRK